MIAERVRTIERYRAIFREEQSRSYPVVDALEARLGYALERGKLEDAARILACPLKIRPPNWQHGRVIYAVVRHSLASCRARVLLLDIGTAKGFSALCLLWGMQAAGLSGTVVSVDVIDPRSRESRNTIAEVTTPQTLIELLAPWPESGAIKFLQSTGISWLEKYAGRIHLAFIDGKHLEAVVRQEAALLRARQSLGDVIVFDDLQIQGVRRAVDALDGHGYAIERLEISPDRAYAIARRQ